MRVILMQVLVNVELFLRTVVKNVPVREKKKSAVMEFVGDSVIVIRNIKTVTSA